MRGVGYMSMIAAVAILSAMAAHAMGDEVSFDGDRVGQPPTGWSLTKTGQGKPKWLVVRDDSAPSKPNVLRQSGKATFPLALKDGSSIKSGFVAVNFKAISGAEDQAGGLVWRAQDANNYYVVRANALEGNVVLYKTVNGKRSALDIVGRKGGYGVKAAVAPGEWHKLRVEFSGRRFRVTFNDRIIFEVEDSTFLRAGQVGVWTKADSVTAFDDFSFGEVK
jgi:hypothetical protein